MLVSRAPTVDAEGAAVTASGAHQAGIARPAVPQRHCIVAVGDLDTGALRASLAVLGEVVLRLTDRSAPVTAVTPDGPGDLTITVGVGARALAATARPELASLVGLPSFRGDDALPADRVGGDVLLSVNATDPTILAPALDALTSAIAGFRLRWSDLGFRGPASEGVTRNPFGYHDGIIVPRSAADLDADVWIQEGALAGGSICVVRRFALDTESFREMSQTQRDATIGRHQVSGAPLSGGGLHDEVDLTAKKPNGDLVIPAHAHARATHPSFTGSTLMLRRSYNYRTDADDQGHLFICFQNDVGTFSRTQLRLDEVDGLMSFATPTATAAFAVLPGFTTARPLGSPLF